jgi:hypothetical protein
MVNAGESGGPEEKFTAEFVLVVYRERRLSETRGQVHLVRQRVVEDSGPNRLVEGDAMARWIIPEGPGRDLAESAIVAASFFPESVDSSAQLMEVVQHPNRRVRARDGQAVTG